MHDIEPFYGWRESYIASEDDSSPFYGREYDQFTFRNKVYNYFIHPQWDSFGTETLYIKILFVDYQLEFAVLEFIGEWNDCLNNDIMFLKREIIDKMIDRGIKKFVLCCDKVLNFHSSDSSYYEEWSEEIIEEGGWICAIETQEHVKTEWESQNLQFYINFGDSFDTVNWRKLKPLNLYKKLEILLNQQTLSLH